MKKVLLTMASLVMLASMTFAQNETPMLPESHGALTNQPAWGGSQTFDLSQGWNWWSTYVNGVELQALETALGDNGQIIKFKTGMVQNAGNGLWDGTLTSLDIANMYAIQMSNELSFTLRGPRAVIADVPIEVAPGWSWISYPVSFNMPIDYALAGYTDAADEDIIKNATQVAVYNATSGTWLGTLTEFVPGQGYMISSTSTATSTFYYPAVPSSSKGMAPEESNATEWQPQRATSHPYNMNMIAVVSMDGNELRSDNVEIGVFNGETCRGAVRPMYVESLDQYVVFLTMFGEENEPYRFRMLDHETGNVYESNEVSVSFKANDVIGRLRSPFELKFNSKAIAANSLNLFPNPVNRGEMVNMTLPGEGTVTVEVVNMLGSTMKTMRVAQGSTELSADMAPGIYTIKVTDAQGQVYVNKLVVK